MLTGPKEFVYSSDYQLSLGGVPVDPQRGQRILTFLLSHRLLSPRRLLQPAPASLKSMARIHSESWLDRLRSPEALVKVFGFEVDDQVLEVAIDAQRSAVGGTLLAARRAIGHPRTCVNLGGGLHHATPDQGMGFCIFNDIAVAIGSVRSEGFEEPILVIDLDLHDGNGTRIAFSEDTSVFTFSIHNQHWDESDAEASIAVALGSEVDDATYLDAVEGHLLPLLERFRPGLVFYLAGTDPAANDRLGDWNISAEAMLERDQLVVDSVRERLGAVPLVITLAGGYGNHAWRHSARTFGWLCAGEVIEPPATAAITLMSYRRLASRLDDRYLTAEPGGEGDDLFALTEEDVTGGLGIVGEKTRLLDRYSRHGVELLLERSGLLDQLRRRGFPNPVVRFDLASPAGETTRIYADAGQRELLVEVRVRIDQRSLPGFSLLSIEWLLMQNPRLGFAGRLALPGQGHPGLGMLGDVMSVMVILAENRNLDGIAFVPSHYHLATQGKRYLRFADPVDEAWFRAIQRAVADVPLLEGTHAVAEGRIIDRTDGEPIAWRPTPMVLPLAGHLRERMMGSDYEQQVERRLDELDLELVDR